MRTDRDRRTEDYAVIVLGKSLKDIRVRKGETRNQYRKRLGLGPVKDGEKRIEPA